MMHAQLDSGTCSEWGESATGLEMCWVRTADGLRVHWTRVSTELGPAVVEIDAVRQATAVAA
ncbi:MAG TPA: hypothetical protein VKV73_23705 [Chloroflexota bacterium]|nr:hypothetical protein [Chloroflexota bacterium]